MEPLNLVQETNFLKFFAEKGTILTKFLVLKIFFERRSIMKERDIMQFF